MYNKILVGIDGSKDSDHALEVALELARIHGAKVHVFHSVPHHFELPIFYPLDMMARTPVETTSMKFNEAQLQREYENAGRSIIDHAKQFVAGKGLPPSMDVEYHLELQVSPVDFAVDFAANNGVDLIVVGCHGHHSRIRRAILGTTAFKIVNESPCQVLVVR